VAAKNRFALALVGTFGDARVVEPLEKIATDDRNENACHTLGLISGAAGMDAARALDRIMKVYRVKYPNVRGAAEEAFDAIAESVGKTPFELADAMISDFGMKNGRIVLKGQKIFATIDDHQKVAFIDAKYQPAKAPSKVPVIKELQDAVKESARQLKNNLEYYLIVRRRWDWPAFEAFFETNPLAFSFARGFVWGTYEGAKLQKTFRVTKDAEHVGVDGKVVAIPKTAQVALVHPLELDAASRAKWLAALATAQVVPAFAQLDRPTFMPNDDERARAKCFRFEDKELSSLTFKGRAERRGWRRGSVVDSGEVSAYRKVFPHDKIEVFIGTEGMNVTSYADDGEGHAEGSLLRSPRCGRHGLVHLRRAARRGRRPAHSLERGPADRLLRGGRRSHRDHEGERRSRGVTPEAELELRARGLEGATIERVLYQRAERVDDREHAVLHGVFLELGDRRVEIGTDDAFGAHHGFGVSLREKKLIDRAFGEIADVTDAPAWKAHAGKSITRARIAWGDVRASLRQSFAIGVAIHSDWLRRPDYPAALELDTAGGRVTFAAARRGEDGIVPFVNALLVSF